MSIIVRRALEGCLLPKNFAGLAVKTDHFEKVFVIGADAVRMNILLVTVHVLDGSGARNDGPFNGRGKKNFVTPDDRRRMAATFNRRLPLNIFRRVPGRGQIFLFRSSLPGRPAPLRPVRSSGAG